VPSLERAGGRPSRLKEKLHRDIASSANEIVNFTIMVSETTSTASDTTWTAVLGQGDFPVDGVEDYCTFLGEALSRRGVKLKQIHVDWDSLGWVHALRQLSRESISWRGQWVLLQFTALAWSRRGFPFTALVALRALRRSGARVAVVFHEPFRQTATPTVVNRVRGECQDWVINKLYEGAERAIFADPLSTIHWLPNKHAKAAFIPIGANIPELQPVPESVPTAGGTTKTVAVFCLTDPPNRRKELADISHAVRFATSKGSKIRLVFLGRGTQEAQEDIDRAFAGIPAEVRNLGLLPAAEVSYNLADSTVMLCVRGSLFPRRGSAIAGIACGLPIIGYAGSKTGFPITEAGLELVPEGDRDALARALDHVLSDDRVRQDLCRRSRRAHADYFSWEKIAERFATELPDG
jgi:glycosyltransferase involved in cell wall biosynthesis